MGRPGDRAGSPGTQPYPGGRRRRGGAWKGAFLLPCGGEGTACGGCRWRCRGRRCGRRRGRRPPCSRGWRPGPMPCWGRCTSRGRRAVRWWSSASSRSRGWWRCGWPCGWTSRGAWRGRRGWSWSWRGRSSRPRQPRSGGARRWTGRRRTRSSGWWARPTSSSGWRRRSCGPPRGRRARTRGPARWRRPASSRRRRSRRSSTRRSRCCVRS